MSNLIQSNNFLRKIASLNINNLICATGLTFFMIENAVTHSYRPFEIKLIRDSEHYSKLILS